MHDTDSNPSALHYKTPKEGSIAPAVIAQKKQQSASENAPVKTESVGILKRILQFIARLFGSHAATIASQPAVDSTAIAERSAVSRAAHMPEPVAFIGDTASTLITPIGSYAGKPVEQAMRKRAEQQFKTMDLSQTTMN